MAAGEWTEVTLTWNTHSDDGGNYTATVASENDSDTIGVTVQSPTVFNVTIDETNSPVTEGDVVEVNATITNSGETSGTQTIGLDVEDQSNPVDAQDVGLRGGESTTITLEWQTSDTDGGPGNKEKAYNVTVNTENDVANETVTV